MAKLTVLNSVGLRWVYIPNFSPLGPVVIEIQPVLCSFFTTFLLVGVRKRPLAQRPFEIST